MKRTASAAWQGDLKTGEGDCFYGKRRPVAHAIFVYHTVRKRQGHESGRISRGCACGMLHDGAVRPVK